MRPTVISTSATDAALTFQLEPATTLKGELQVPGDKSMSHRSILFGAIAHGVTEVTGFLEGEDSLHTLAAFQAMGVRIERGEAGRVTLYGRGPAAVTAAADTIYLGNSGTAMRLMTGLLAGLQLPTRLSGDASLSGRPMRRIVGPLASMGAVIDTDDNGTPPLEIRGGHALQGMEYTCPIASAQVKSCLLLAGLHANGRTTVHEPAVTRDHTERMLRGFGVEVHVDGLTASIEGGQLLQATSLQVPGDISSAAFFLVGASMTPGSTLRLLNVGINPTRAGVIDILKLMGADINIENERDAGGEPVADLLVQGRQLHGIEIPATLVSLAIDEFPALFVAAAAASGETVVSGAEELRVKESDRIQVMTDGLRALGCDIADTPDGARIRGGQLGGGRVDSKGDHRIAMAFAMASLIADGPVEVLDCANVNTSFPDFAASARAAGLHINELSN
ncbi:MAG: 3-phosphoshikimate 1-carboxyvinyltransferase [Granulosicoccus sp.]